MLMFHFFLYEKYKLRTSVLKNSVLILKLKMLYYIIKLRYLSLHNLFKRQLIPIEQHHQDLILKLIKIHILIYELLHHTLKFLHSTKQYHLVLEPFLQLFFNLLHDNQFEEYMESIYIVVFFEKYLVYVKTFILIIDVQKQQQQYQQELLNQEEAEEQILL